MNTNTNTNTALTDIANEIVEMIRNDLFDHIDSARLNSDEGLIFDYTDQGFPAIVAWVRNSKTVVWAGNDFDFDMTRIVALPL
jgi:hypothetical protein